MTEQEIRWAELQIQKARKERGWSQESVCTGICAVSYYSKIEAGNVRCSPEILEQIASRLDISLACPHSKRKEQCERIFDLLRRGRHLQAREKFLRQFPMFAPVLEPYRAQPSWQEERKTESGCQPQTDLKTDFCLPEEYVLADLFAQIELRTAFGKEFLECLQPEEQAVCHVLDGEYERAMNLCTRGWVQLLTAEFMYRSHRLEPPILDRLQQAFVQAGLEGYPHLMAEISHTAGIVCANLPDQKSAMQFFERAMNIYQELDDPLSLGEVKYNLACTLLELKDYEKALKLLQDLPKQSVMDIHKQVICLELLGRKEEALALLETYPKASYLGWNPDLIDRIFQVCRYRLCDPDWLKNPEYGQARWELFEALRQSDLHKGFAQFHLPWVIQYLKASRQYAAVVHLLETFPGKPPFILP